MTRRAGPASTRPNCWPILTPGASTGRFASIPRCSRSATTAVPSRRRPSRELRLRASRAASGSRRRRSSSTSSTCAAFRASTRRSLKARAEPSPDSRIPHRSRIWRRSASPQSRSCRLTRSSTNGICRRSASRTPGATTRWCSARPIRALLPAAGRMSARRPTRCMRRASRRSSTSSSTTTAKATSSGRRCRSAASTTRLGSDSIRAIRRPTSTIWAPAIASRSTARWSSTWRSARSGAG